MNRKRTTSVYAVNFKNKLPNIVNRNKLIFTVWATLPVVQNAYIKIVVSTYPQAYIALQPVLTPIGYNYVFRIVRKTLPGPPNTAQYSCLHTCTLHIYSWYLRETNLTFAYEIMYVINDIILCIIMIIIYNNCL